MDLISKSQSEADKSTADLLKTIQEKDLEIKDLKELLQDLKSRQLKLATINKSLKKEVVKLNSRHVSPLSPCLSRNNSFSSRTSTLNTEENVEKLEYLKIIFIKFLQLAKDDKKSLIPVIGNLLGFSRQELEKLCE
jgi:hypothetical protein